MPKIQRFVARKLNTLLSQRPAHDAILRASGTLGEQVSWAVEAKSIEFFEQYRLIRQPETAPPSKAFHSPVISGCRHKDRHPEGQWPLADAHHYRPTLTWVASPEAAAMAS